MRPSSWILLAAATVGCQCGGNQGLLVYGSPEIGGEGPYAVGTWGLVTVRYEAIDCPYVPSDPKHGQCVAFGTVNSAIASDPSVFEVTVATGAVKVKALAPGQSAISIYVVPPGKSAPDKISGTLVAAAPSSIAAHADCSLAWDQSLPLYLPGGSKQDVL